MGSQGRRSLLLDSDTSNRMLVEFALAMGRVDYVETSTGEDALVAWKPGEFDFAFLNAELPDMSGLDVARYIRKRDEKIAIIISSVNDDPEATRAAVVAGCDLYLVKPFQLDTLLTLAKILDAENLRAGPKVLIIDDQLRPRWEARR